MLVAEQFLDLAQFAPALSSSDTKTWRRVRCDALADVYAGLARVAAERVRGSSAAGGVHERRRTGHDPGVAVASPDTPGTAARGRVRAPSATGRPWPVGRGSAAAPSRCRPCPSPAAQRAAARVGEQREQQPIALDTAWRLALLGVGSTAAGRQKQRSAATVSDWLDGAGRCSAPSSRKRRGSTTRTASEPVSPC